MAGLTDLEQKIADGLWLSDSELERIPNRTALCERMAVYLVNNVLSLPSVIEGLIIEAESRGRWIK